jgi:glucose 1-dehydrogenase
MLLDGRKAIVTGASSGIGKATAAAVAWAAIGEANYVTGTTIVVDGGMSLYSRFV